MAASQQRGPPRRRPRSPPIAQLPVVGAAAAARGALQAVSGASGVGSQWVSELVTEAAA
eukprot:COSAG01_NODE_41929_length_445_cov_2.173410_1_plen_58_part_01